MEQYELASKPMVPGKKEPYDARKDTHHYLASVHQSTSFAQITNRISNQFTVQSTGEQNDVDTQRLQESLAEAVKGRNNKVDGVAIISINEDPEQAKRRAELAERDKLRAQRRRQNAEERERDRANRVLGRSGLRPGGGGGGLTVSALEADDGPTPGRPRARPVKKQRRRGSEYSDGEDDDERHGHRTKEDEYDPTDPFMAPSDEEEQEDGGDESDEEIEMEEIEERPRAKKLDRKKNNGDGAGGRGKRSRLVVDEDEDDDDE
jgi:RNA polymerase-associated protein LEO1